MLSVHALILGLLALVLVEDPLVFGCLAVTLGRFSAALG
jgi:hypothetical protein